MGNLADSWDATGGEYLPVGWHTVKVAGHTNGENPHNGNRNVEFQLVAENSKKSKVTFWLTGDAIRAGFLANFAKACGLTREEARSYDPLVANAHTRLHGKTVKVLVSLQNEKYHAVEGGFNDWASVDDKTPEYTPSEPKPQHGSEETKADDEIPF